MVYNKLSIFLTLLLLIFLVHSPITGYSATGSGSIEGIVCDLAGQPLSDIAILAIIDQNPYSNIFYQISFNTASFYPFFRDDISIYNDGLFESFSQPSASLCDLLGTPGTVGDSRHSVQPNRVSWPLASPQQRWWRGIVGM